MVMKKNFLNAFMNGMATMGCLVAAYHSWFFTSVLISVVMMCGAMFGICAFLVVASMGEDEFRRHIND